MHKQDMGEENRNSLNKAESILQQGPERFLNWLAEQPKDTIANSTSLMQDYMRDNGVDYFDLYFIPGRNNDRHLCFQVAAGIETYLNSKLITNHDWVFEIFEQQEERKEKQQQEQKEKQQQEQQRKIKKYRKEFGDRFRRILGV